jgi:hypothetical protein
MYRLSTAICYLHRLRFLYWTDLDHPPKNSWGEVPTQLVERRYLSSFKMCKEKWLCIRLLNEQLRFIALPLLFLLRRAILVLPV